MGACTFEIYEAGEKLADAFDRAYAQSGWEDGHSYSGTISSKSGVAAITRTPMPQVAARRLAQQLIDANDPRVDDKWGPAAAIPVCADEALITRTVKATAQSVATHPGDAERALADAVTVGEGEVIVSVVADALPPLRHRVRVTATEGAAVTRYRVVCSGRVQGEYDTQSQARAALTELLRDDNSPWAHEAYIEGVRRRADGAPLVRASRTPIARRITGTVTVGRVRPGTAPVGWLMFGWAPS